MQKLCLVNLIVASLIFQACGSNHNVPLNKPSAFQATTNGKIKVPNVIKNSTEKGFTIHQDTLFYNQTKYSGFVYALYNAKDTMSLLSYFNGIEEGVQKKWYPNKKIASNRFYHAGKKIGKHVGFWENGQAKFEYYFLDGEHHGIAKEWYRNGNPYRIFHYAHGYEEGSQKMWWENGVIRANYVVKNGRRYGLIGLKLCMNPMDTIIKNTK